MKIKITLIAGLFFVLGISLLYAQTSPVSEFSAYPALGNSVPHTVFFTNQSTSADTWLWNFGDGSTSTSMNPIHTYTTTGAYTVSLKADNTTNGTSDIITKVDEIKISIPNAIIGGSQQTGCGPFTMNFSDASTANGAPLVSWSWDFGDGNTSTNQNPSHTYENSGVYTVSLLITDGFGNSDTATFTNMVEVTGPNLAFEVDHTLILSNSSVAFTNLSNSASAVATWTWDFGDGTPISNQQNPTHTYVTPGDYNVSLTALDVDGCSKTITKTAYVKVVAAPVNVVVNNDTGSCNASVSLPDFDGASNGNAIQLDGVNDYVTAPLPSLFNSISTNDFTVEMWVNRTSSGASTRLIFAQFNNTNFVSSLVNSSGVFYVFVHSNGVVYSVNTTYVLPLNQWVHTAFRWNATSKTISVLINGSPRATISGGSSSLGTSNRMTIGSKTDGSQVFGGKIDEIRIWDLQRSDADIVDNMNTCVSETSPNLITYYKMNEITGSSNAIDASGNGYDGTLINCDTSTAWTTGTVSCGLYATNDVTNSNNASGVYSLGNTTITWTVSNTSGDTVTCTQQITVEDTENPVISCLSAITINTDTGSCTSTASLGTPTATDNCGVPTITNDAPTAFPIGNTTVTWTATDNAGNTATCTQIVTVEDTENPVISCPSAITISTDIGSCTSSASLGTPTATDNCGVPTITNDAPTAFPIGNTTVTWTATDNSGNTATCTQIVTVEDTENPVVSCPSAITISTDIGSCTSTASIGTPTATDNCGVPTITNDAPTAFPIGNTTVTWTATDNAGNTVTCTQIVTVEDTENPTAITQDITVSLDNSGNATITPAMINNGSYDNCSVALLVLDRDTFSCVDVETPVLVTLTITDASGNSSSATALVTVEDNNAPIVFTQDISMVLDASGTAIITPEMINNGSYDDCGIESFQLSIATFTCPRLDEAQLVTLTVIDVNGNSSTGDAYVSFTGFDLDLDGIADSCDAEQNPDVTPNLGISPNDDGENDTWIIENITNFPKAKIEVFDRNGVAVFNAIDYQNDWRGLKQNSGELLPVGSYYFVINIFGDGSLFIKGWLYINY
ncbi:PKD domain-containing protein [Flavobacterium sp. J27]|uniref:PKD domain-containing protein n=1 Tax=Flavobacterium sp. J27 TaxID=2060419 RepID=UPI0010327A46|nr:PKD domain-containing protein [Flavobacterium sp. J27]